MAVGVDHAGHDDAVGGVDLRRALGNLESGADRRDRLPGDKDVGVAQDRVRVVHREHGRIPEHNRLARLRCSHEETSTVRGWSQGSRTIVR